MIKFTQITEKLQYPPKYKSEISKLHSLIVNHVISHFSNTFAYRKHVVDILNTISYSVMCADYLPTSATELLELPIPDMDPIKAKLGSLYLTDREIIWDVSEPSAQQPITARPAPEAKPVIVTDKADLYIKPPVVPQFDFSKVWASGVVDGVTYAIYTSLPEVPTKQNQISATTDVDNFTDADLLKLFPTSMIRTRHSSMYEPVDGVEFDEVLGVIFEISGFTSQQVRDNIIQYPHLYQLTRMLNNNQETFYKNIEIDGELKDILDVWDTLPDTAKLPKTKEFIKEYVVRRYLLERDINHIKHKYPLYGSLDPFLTIFMPPEDYNNYGYSDSLELMRQCIRARVAYKQSRNPVIRRLNDV